MPRTRKAPGTAVDKRNGRSVELPVARLEKFYLPARKPAWLPETRKAWLALWDDPVSMVLQPVDRPVLLRWADSLERYQRMLVLADLDPVGHGSMGQPVPSPLYGIADAAIRVAQACEAQLGVGAKNRAALGLVMAAERKSLLDLNRVLTEMADEPDPRLY